MALQSSGQISFSDIAAELGLSTSRGVDMRGMSSDAGFSTPDSISEFYGYSDSLTYTVNITNGTSFQKSGNAYGLVQGQGSVNSGNPMGTAGWNALVNLSSAHHSELLDQFRIIISNTRGSRFTHNWWSTLTIARSGYTSIVLNRTSATTAPYGTTGYRAVYGWTGYTTAPITQGGSCTWTFSE